MRHRTQRNHGTARPRRRSRAATTALPGAQMDWKPPPPLTGLDAQFQETKWDDTAARTTPTCVRCALHLFYFSFEKTVSRRAGGGAWATVDRVGRNKSRDGWNAPHSRRRGPDTPA